MKRKVFKVGKVGNMFIGVTVDMDRLMDIVCKAATNQGQRSTNGAMTVELRGYPELKGAPPSADLQKQIHLFLNS